jgi:multiple sugar transport system ATP-binding protein
LANSKAPKDRDIAMVFQSYALYPHMTVGENMGFPLQLAKVDKATIKQKVQQAAEMLELTQHLDRKPSNLSGGQRQRVAMGRAIVRSPKAFLMDEPLSNLDAKLRVQMRTQVSRIQKALGTTTLYVTHDQTEAMTLGDRVVVMRGGLIQQVGSPQHLYDNPANLFVAGFIGSPAMNFANVTVTEANGSLLAENSGLRITLPGETAQRLRGHVGREITLGVRPEDLTVAGDATADHPSFDAVIEVVEQLGSEILLDMKVGEGMMVASVEPSVRVKVRDKLRLAMRPSRLHVFDAKTEAAI